MVQIMNAGSDITYINIFYIFVKPFLKKLVTISKHIGT